MIPGQKSATMGFQWGESYRLDTKGLSSEGTDASFLKFFDSWAWEMLLKTFGSEG